MSPKPPEAHGGAEQQTLLILGASGDLTARLLLPGLGGLLACGAAEGLLLVGSGADDWDDDRWRTRVADSFATASADGPQVDAVAKNARYSRADVTSEGDLRKLALPEYGEVLKGVLEGDPTLSVRGDMAVDCWRIIEPVLKAWREDAVPLQEYAAGSTGPESWPLSGVPQK